MGSIIGKSGYIIVGMGVAPTIGNAVECIDNWSLNITTDAIETTGFGTTVSVVNKTFEAGLKSATGNASGTMDGTNAKLSTIIAVITASATTVVNLVLHMDSAHHFSVPSIITGWTVTAPVADKVTIGFDFTASNSIIYG